MFSQHLHVFTSCYNYQQLSAEELEKLERVLDSAERIAQRDTHVVRHTKNAGPLADNTNLVNAIGGAATRDPFTRDSYPGALGHRQSDASAVWASAKLPAAPAPHAWDADGQDHGPSRASAATGSFSGPRHPGTLSAGAAAAAAVDASSGSPAARPAKRPHIAPAAEQRFLPHPSRENIPEVRRGPQPQPCLALTGSGRSGLAPPTLDAAYPVSAASAGTAVGAPAAAAAGCVSQQACLDGGCDDPVYIAGPVSLLPRPHQPSVAWQYQQQQPQQQAARPPSQGSGHDHRRPDSANGGTRAHATGVSRAHQLEQQPQPAEPWPAASTYGRPGRPAHPDRTVEPCPHGDTYGGHSLPVAWAAGRSAASGGPPPLLPGPVQGGQASRACMPQHHEAQQQGGHHRQQPEKQQQQQYPNSKRASQTPPQQEHPQGPTWAPHLQLPGQDPQQPHQQHTHLQQPCYAAGAQPLPQWTQGPSPGPPDARCPPPAHDRVPPAGQMQPPVAVLQPCRGPGHQADAAYSPHGVTSVAAGGNPLSHLPTHPDFPEEAKGTGCAAGVEAGSWRRGGASGSQGPNPPVPSKPAFHPCVERPPTTEIANPANLPAALPQPQPQQPLPCGPTASAARPGAHPPAAAVGVAGLSSQRAAGRGQHKQQQQVLPQQALFVPPVPAAALIGVQQSALRSGPAAGAAAAAAAAAQPPQRPTQPQGQFSHARLQSGRPPDPPNHVDQRQRQQLEMPPRQEQQPQHQQQRPPPWMPPPLHGPMAPPAAVVTAAAAPHASARSLPASSPSWTAPPSWQPRAAPSPPQPAPPAPPPGGTYTAPAPVADPGPSLTAGPFSMAPGSGAAGVDAGSRHWSEAAWRPAPVCEPPRRGDCTGAATTAAVATATATAAAAADAAMCTTTHDHHHHRHLETHAVTAMRPWAAAPTEGSAGPSEGPARGPPGVMTGSSRALRVERQTGGAHTDVSAQRWGGGLGCGPGPQPGAAPGGVSVGQDIYGAPPAPVPAPGPGLVPLPTQALLAMQVPAPAPVPVQAPAPGPGLDRTRGVGSGESPGEVDRGVAAALQTPDAGRASAGGSGNAAAVAASAVAAAVAQTGASRAWGAAQGGAEDARVEPSSGSADAAGIAACNLGAGGRDTGSVSRRLPASLSNGRIAASAGPPSSSTAVVGAPAVPSSGAAAAAAASGAESGAKPGGRPAALPSIAEVRAARAAAAAGGGGSGSQRPATRLPVLQFQGSVRYAATAVEVDWLCGQLQRAQPRVIGLDMEWRPQYVAGSGGNPTALLQICYAAAAPGAVPAAATARAASPVTAITPVMPLARPGLSASTEPRTCSSSLPVSGGEPGGSAAPSSSNSGGTGGGLDADISAGAASARTDAAAATADGNGGRHCCCLLLHIFYSGITPRLRALLEAEELSKVGVNITGDANKLKRDYGVEMKGMVELDGIANDRVLQHIEHITINTEYRTRWSLSALVDTVLRRHLPKPNNIRCGNWERRPLEAAQQRYAALDAYAGLAVWAALMRLPLRRRPPLPAQRGAEVADPPGAVQVSEQETARVSEQEDISCRGGLKDGGDGGAANEAAASAGAVGAASLADASVPRTAASGLPPSDVDGGAVCAAERSSGTGAARAACGPDG